MRRDKPLTASRRSPGVARPRPLARLGQAPAPALALFAAGLALALVWGDYVLMGLAVMPLMGLALAWRGMRPGR